MIDRHEFAEELILREQIRKAIQIVKGRRSKRVLQERKDEQNLRFLIRDFLKEGQAGVAETAKHDSTGINALEDLLRNSNLLSVLEKGYKSLTTDKQQRESYRNHILVSVEKSLAPEESRKEAGEDEELEALQEDIDIQIDRPEDDPDFIDVNDKEEKPEEEGDPRDEFGIGGEDKTGRNRAYTDFHNIEKVILTSFDDLDNPEDSTMFEEYLIKNLALYFDKFESELDVNVEEPEEAADAVMDADKEEAAGGTGGGGELDLGLDTSGEEDIANIELQEIIKHLDVDDIIENIL